MSQFSKVLFYLIAVWCVVVGVFNQTISTAKDLPWVADALAGTNVDAFNPILAIWAHWIGMFLITAGVTLLIILTKLPVTNTSVIVTGVLAIGTVGAQSFSVISLGVYAPMSYVLYCIPVVAVIATVTGYIALEDEGDT